MNTTLVAEELMRIVNGGAWHGPSLRELLDGVTPEQAAAHPLPGRHSIWEIVNHLTVWHRVVVKRINGERIYPQGEKDWPPVIGLNENDWQKAQADMYASAEVAASAIRKITEGKMNQKIAGYSYPLHVMIMGLPSHDACHAGQISLLHKMMEETGS